MCGACVVSCRVWHASAPIFKSISRESSLMQQTTLNDPNMGAPVSPMSSPTGNASTMGYSPMTCTLRPPYIPVFLFPLIAHCV
jgi:hypothetical protein